MLKRVLIAAIAASLALAPALSSEQVKPQTQTAPEAASQATASGSAVVSKGLTGTTITVPASAQAQEFHVDLKPLIEAILPYIAAAVGGFISVLGTIVTVWMKQKFNIEIESKDREAFQQAATNAAGAMIARGAVQLEQATGRIMLDSAALASVVNTVALRVPDAIRRLGVTPEMVASTIASKVPQVLTGATPSAAPVAPSGDALMAAALAAPPAAAAAAPPAAEDAAPAAAKKAVAEALSDRGVKPKE